MTNASVGFAEFPEGSIRGPSHLEQVPHSVDIEDGDTWSVSAVVLLELQFPTIELVYIINPQCVQNKPVT